jgi:hypothetical protein
MISRSPSNGRSPSIGARLLSCLAMLALSGCGPKILENRTIERVAPPAGLLTCEPAPAVPTVDQLAGPDGDNVLAAYVARLEYARRDCECAVKELRAWVDQVPAPKECSDGPD